MKSEGDVKTRCEVRGGGKSEGVGRQRGCEGSGGVKSEGCDVREV